MKNSKSRYLPFIIVIAIGAAVDHWYGAIGYLRFFGIFWLGVCTYFCFVPELPFHMGNIEVARLKGWAKFVVISILVGVGICLIVFAPEITCVSNKYKLLCA